MQKIKEVYEIKFKTEKQILKLDELIEIVQSANSLIPVRDIDSVYYWSFTKKTDFIHELISGNCNTVFPLYEDEETGNLYVFDGYDEIGSILWFVEDKIPILGKIFDKNDNNEYFYSELNFAAQKYIGDIVVFVTMVKSKQNSSLNKEERSNIHFWK